MPLQEYDVLYSKSQYNTAVAASASEFIGSSDADRRQFGQFNFLYVKNRDAVDVKIILDGDTNQTGNIWEVAAGDTLILEPEDGFRFSFLSATNLSSTTAEVANKVLYKWARMEPKGRGKDAINVGGAKVING